LPPPYGPQSKPTDELACKSKVKEDRCDWTDPILKESKMSKKSTGVNPTHRLEKFIKENIDDVPIDVLGAENS
jgi:hypothetical protein